MFDIIFFVFISFMMCVMYFVVYFVAPKFFEKTSAPLTWKRTLPSILTIVALGFIAIYVVVSTPDPWISNRIEHALGGGFIATTMCYLAVRDSKIQLSYLQFFLITLMFVTMLGVGNEILEFICQHYYGYISSSSVEDTWLDLISNTLGIIAGLICFTPLIKRANK